MLNIIPTPKKIKESKGYFELSGVGVFAEPGTDVRVIRALLVLCREIGEACGRYVPLSYTAPSEKAVAVSYGDGGEGYRLTVDENRITIEGEGAAGAFYAVQSLRQLLKENGTRIPCVIIEDEPDFSYRGFYHDVTRGRVPTLEKLKDVADTLAFYKVNSLQLYIEDAFTFKELEGVVASDSALTPEEIIELDSYCRDRFIDLVPSMATFGHLFTLLQSERYNHICELKGHKLSRNYWLERQWHHTVDVYHPETFEVIRSMIEQYLPLFSSKYFNICCDETMDLCGGANEGRDKGEAYFYHLDKLVSLVRSYGKQVMLWGDECMARPDEAREHLPDDAVVLNWCYRREVAEWIPKMFWERGFSQIACTGTSSWENFIEDIEVSTGNISTFAAHAKKYGCLGILNTNWGDFGHICAFGCNLYGLLFGAQKSWNVDAETGLEFEEAASLLLYGVSNFNMADTLRALSRAAATCNWSNFVIWHSSVTLEGKDMPLRYGGERGIRYTAEDAVRSLDICKEELERLCSLEGKNRVIEEIILAVRAIALMNREVLYVNGVAGYTDRESLKKDFDSWLSDYSASWLSDNKPSDLWRIEEFIKRITDVPIKPGHKDLP